MKPPVPESAAGLYARALNTRVGKVVVTLFCAWYVVAIGVYALPGDSKSMTMHAIKNAINPWTSPSVLITSQWQQWNLFAPDPLRRVTKYRIEAFRDGQWQGLIVLEKGVFPFWRHANHFKLLINIMEGSNAQIAERYVQSFCEPFGLQPGTEVKLTYLVWVIPYLDIPEGSQWWRSSSPSYSEQGGFSTFCPEVPLTPIVL